MSIQGDWDAGYVLDWHTTKSYFLGHNEFRHYKRTEVGEAVFQLKYRNDLTKIEVLAETLVAKLKQAFQSVSLVIPMPPSKYRPVQPVLELSKKISEKLCIPVFDNILLKNRSTPQMKDIGNKEERRNVLMGCFYINDAIRNNGCWDALIVDDLYSSGASLSAASRTLKTYSKINKVFAAALSRTKQL